LGANSHKAIALAGHKICVNFPTGPTGVVFLKVYPFKDKKLAGIIPVNLYMGLISN